MVGKFERWRQVTPFQFQWEAVALEYVRARLADSGPNHGWENVEFAAGGTLNEVDLLVGTRKGLFLIESYPGRILGQPEPLGLAPP
jgi:hypothetical protein